MAFSWISFLYELELSKVIGRYKKIQWIQYEIYGLQKPSIRGFIFSFETRTIMYVDTPIFSFWKISLIVRCCNISLIERENVILDIAIHQLKCNNTRWHIQKADIYMLVNILFPKREGTWGLLMLLTHTRRSLLLLLFI